MQLEKEKEENQHIIDTIERFFWHRDIKPVKRFTVEGISKADDFEAKPEKVEEVYGLGKDILMLR